MRNTAAVSKGGDHFVVLDGLRGVAAIFVVAHHVTRSGVDCTLFSRGYLAVDFFFMLSGFVLSHAYDYRFAAGLSWAAFIKLRLRRLWPTMAIGIMLGISVALGQGMPPNLLAIRAIAALLFIPLPIATVHLFILNGVQWSLFFELFANALHAGALYRALSTSLCRLLVVSVVSLFGVAYLHGDLTVGHVIAGWTGGFARVMAAYVGGMLLYRLSCSVGVSVQNHYALWPVAALVAALIAPAMLPVNWWWTDPVVVVVVFPAVLWLGATAAVGARVRALASVAGALSYPLYAFHMPILALGERLGDEIGGVPRGVFRLAAVMLAVTLAWLWKRVHWPATSRAHRVSISSHA
jgi:peptidoglycan/LPS O-acetylase OafA/YrhL